MALLGIALAGTAYPLWWDHRSSTVGHGLVQRALRFSAPPRTQRGKATSCPTLKAAERGATALGKTRPLTRARPGVLEIPAIGLTAPVLEGLSDAVLEVSVGHDPQTVWPGSPGESVLLAHDVSYFSGLSRLRRGAEVIWRLGCERAVYQVFSARVTTPGALLPVPPSGSGLALVTCWPTNALFWTPDRYVVEASLVSRSSASPPRRPPASSIVGLRLSAPPSLVAEGLSLSETGIVVGRLAIKGSPSASFRQGAGPLSAARDALEEYAAAYRAAAAQRRTWWSALSVAGVPMPAAWSLAYVTNVTLVVSGSRVEGAVLASQGVTVTLASIGGTLFVARVDP